MRKPKKKISHVIRSHAVDFCEVTTIHGFAYWVRGETFVEKLFWVAIVATGFVCSGFNISYAIRDWLQEPGVTIINTFSKVHF